jgi:hypothetical protein
MSDLFGTDYEGRKAIPIFEGVVMYFPKALAAVAEVSHAGNQQHNPGEPLHWDRGKSMDQYNTALRHMMDHRMGGGRVDAGGHLDLIVNNGWVQETRDKDGVRHLAKAAWRILAALQLAIEEEESGPQQQLGSPDFEKEFKSVIVPANIVREYRESFDAVGKWNVDTIRTEAAKTGLVYCWKPMCEGHKPGSGTHDHV